MPWSYAVLAAVSSCCPPLAGRLLTRYSPVRHSVICLSTRRLPLICFVQLACVKHAASVRPEPGSNSHIQIFSPLLSQLPISIRICVFSLRSSILSSLKRTSLLLFVLRYPLVKVPHSLGECLFNISNHSAFVKRFFRNFFKILFHTAQLLLLILNRYKNCIPKKPNHFSTLIIRTAKIY